MGWCLGVDLGTTWTAAAVLRDGHCTTSALSDHGAEVPSVVALRSPQDGTFLVGEAAQRRGLTEPAALAREFKRRLGDPTPILLHGVPFSAHALTAKLLRWVVDRVQEREGSPPDAVAVTCPANWGGHKRELFAQALAMADLADALVVTEPAAAALRYADLQRLETGTTVAVYDLGGGTFDAAVLRRSATGFELLGTPTGIEQLGGLDVDEAVFAHVLRALGPGLNGLDAEDQVAGVALARLREECTRAKEGLSYDNEVLVPVALPGLHTSVRLTRPELEDLIRPLLSDTVTALKRAIRSADLDPERLDRVLLAGGSSRIPLVRQLLSTELGRPVFADAHPKHLVALGAALAAGAATAVPEPVRGGAPAGSAAVVGPAPVDPVADTEPPPSGPGPLQREVEAPTDPASDGAPPDRTPDQDVVEAGAGTGPYPVPSQARGRGPAPDPDRPRNPRPAGRPGRGVLVAAVAVALLAAGGAVYAGTRPDQDTPTDSLGTQVEQTPTAGPDGSTLPRAAEPLPPDTLVLGSRELGGNEGIYRMSARPGAPLRPIVPPGDSRQQLPVLSPDRRSVVFNREVLVEGERPGAELRVVAADGRGDRGGVLLSTDVGYNTRVSWHPQGRQLAFAWRPGPTEPVDLYVAELDVEAEEPTLGTPERITDDADWETDAAWSPDGTRLAYVAGPAVSGGARFRGDLHVWDVEERSSRPLEETPLGELDPAWSPDSRRLAFIRVHDDRSELRTIDVETAPGGRPRRRGRPSQRGPHLVARR